MHFHVFPRTRAELREKDDVGNLPTDAEIIASCSRTPEAFGEIFDRHFDAVHAYFARRSSRSTADDLAADVFLKAFEIRERYDPDYPNALPWLYGIAQRRLLHHQRSIARGSRALQLLESREGARAIDTTDDVAAQLDALDTVARLEGALATLSPPDRETFMLAIFEGLSYEEIAHATAVPIGTVRSRLSRARTEIRELLARSGKTPIECTTKGAQNDRSA
ncbi:MAG: RNA polymerase sigma factor [Acidimicrobiia bacterium]